jgi:nicotinate dehydrogenase subunit B
MSTLPGSIDANPMLDRWISFDTPSRVTIRSGKVELGQGTVTAIAAIAAGELGVTLDQIEIVAGDTRTAPDEGYTAGSLSLEQGGLAMRWAAATTRMLFTDAAAQALGGDAQDTIVEDGVFSLQGRNVGVDYWSLAPRVDLARSMKELPAPRMSGASSQRAPCSASTCQRSLRAPVSFMTSSCPTCISVAYCARPTLPRGCNLSMRRPSRPCPAYVALSSMEALSASWRRAMTLP